MKINCFSLIFLLLVTVFFSQVLCIHLPQDHRRRPRSFTSLQKAAYSERTRYSNDWAVGIQGGSQMADQIAKKNGFCNLGLVGSLKDIHHFRLIMNSTLRQDSNYKFLAQSDGDAGEWSQIGMMDHITKSLQDEPGVMYAEQQLLTTNYKKNFMTPSDPEFGNQWSLLNTGQIGGPAGRDLNVVPAWMQGITGNGVVVSVVDDGLERDHADLFSNYDPDASFDFVHNDGDPTPHTDSEAHGTSCAGEIGMIKSNGECGVGVAYECSLGGLKFNMANSSDLGQANALSHNSSYIDIYSNSWGPPDFGSTVAGPGHLTNLALETGVQTGRGGKGNIYVWAAGNGGDYFDSCAADGYVSSIYTIGVGAADQSGNQAAYDEECASKMVVTFNDNSILRRPQVTTTDLDDSCTDSFDGTSAAAPLVSGVIALILQANSNLTWRDVQYLIAYTSNSNNLINGNWTVNGAGLRVSHKHGFGAIDAEAMVTRAKRWINVPPQMSTTIPSSISSGTARELDPSMLTFNVNLSNSNNITFLEHVVVTLSLSFQGLENITDPSDYPERGEISVELTSPQGTVSTLLPYRLDDFISDEGYTQWPFMSVHHWGEDPMGQWTLTVLFDPFILNTSASVQVTSHDMTLYGTTETPAAVSSIPSACHPHCARGCSGPTATDCDVCRDYRLSSTLECVSACPNGTTEQNKYCFGTT